MEFREVKKEEYDECAELLAKSFLDYIYFKIIWENENKRFKALKAILKVGVRIFSIEGTQLGMFDDNNNLIATAALMAPNYKSASAFDYLKNGAINAILKCGFIKAKDYVKMNKEANSIINNTKEAHWFVEAFAVAEGYKGQGYGSKMIQEGIIPYVKNHNGNKIMLITNNEKNCNFYKKNGFDIIENQLITYNNSEMPNWTLEYNIEK